MKIAVEPRARRPADCVIRTMLPSSSAIDNVATVISQQALDLKVRNVTDARLALHVGTLFRPESDWGDPIGDAGGQALNRSPVGAPLPAVFRWGLCASM